MNKLVEEAITTKVPITCPRITRSDSFGLNVANLDRINHQPPMRFQSDDSCASIILGEVENIPKPKEFKTKPVNSDAIHVNVMDKENFTSAQLAEERKRIEKRERDLKNKERKLEDKLMKMFQETQQKGRTTSATNVRVQTDKCMDGDVHIVQGECKEGPVQIIIQVNGGNKHISESNPVTVTTKPVKSKKVVPLRDTSSQVFPKTPLKAMVSDNVQAADGSSTSTAYQSLPKVIRTELTDVLSSKGGLPKNRESVNHTKSIASSTLQTYIRRLLGMSRASIDQLEVSDVSTVSTPGSSLINISSNVTQPQHDEPINDQHINKLQNFIKDNHNFISDLEKSLREISMSSDEASNLKAVETVWMETLSKKENEMKIEKKVKKRVPSERDIVPQKKTLEVGPAVIKPILKKPASPKKVKVVESESRINLDKAKKAVHPVRVESETQRCNQRIADLNEMIVKVRREKQRLLENTYSSMGSSVSDPYQNSTEYLEIVRKVVSEGSNNSSGTTTELPSLSEERKRAVTEEQSSLAASKQIGISRDSGLGGVSRPMTASDAPVNSPEIRLTIADTTDGDNTVKSDAIGKQLPLLSNENGNVEGLDANLHKRKPPSSLQRFGPQIEQLDLGHDLSTIIEVDTPIATSRLNSSSNDANRITDQNNAKLAQLLLEISSNTRNTLKIASFPYESSVGNDSTQSISHIKLPIQIEPFPSHASFANGVSGLVDTISIMGENDQEDDHQSNPDPTHIRPFITHQQFAKETSGLCTSQSVAGGLDDDHISFPDVEYELRKRNLLQHSTESVYLDTDGGQKPEAPKPIENKLPTYSTSSSDNLEMEMQRLGINWASSMIKKNKIATNQALATSSSASSNEDHVKSIHSKLNASSMANSSPNVSNKSLGKPLNLKEFLARELIKRSNSLSSSTAHDDSTLASQFLRSLLGSSSDNSSKMSGSLVYRSERHRTSTPVRDNRPSTPGRPPIIPNEETETSRSKSATHHMFSGESGLSSVRGSTGTSSDKEETTSRDASTSGGQLKVPNTQLRSGTNSSSS